MFFPNTLREILDITLQEQGTDVHFGTFSGFYVRVKGELIALDVDQPDAQAALKAFSHAHAGGRCLLVSLQQLMAPDASGKPSNLLNSRVMGQVERAIQEIDTHGAMKSDIEAVVRLGALGNWRLTFYRSDLEGYGLSFRSLPETIPTIEKLLPSPLMPIIPKIKTVLDRGKGLVLVTGTTGSGKSSTLAGLVDYINHNYHRKIITLEDPVEYWHTSDMCMIHHRQVERDTPSFAQGLKSALRQDPDVVLIGELRDLETISLAMTAAETGHLVLATLHSRDVESTITRIIDVFPPSQQTMIRTLLASSLQAVISQSLVATDNEGAQGGRVLHPEVAILSPSKGGVRATIQEGRYHQIKQGLQVMNNEDGAVYYSFERTGELLKRNNLI